jgi:hypothetical protein
MADESVRDIVRRVRSVLQEKGPPGAFLLADLDASISRGVDDLPTPDSKSARSYEITGRRSPEEAELVEILQGVFETYLVTLPSAAASLTTHLHDGFGVDHCEVALDPSLLGDELQVSGRARIDAIVPLVPNEKASSALREIRRLVADTVKGRDE